MALDKNRILNDLGHVMNQLQSADCGCMGKLFSNQGPELPGIGMGAPLPTCGGCRRGCCRGHGPGVNHGQPAYAPCAGEPYSMNNPGVYQSGMGQPGMGQPFMDHSGKYQSGMNQNGMEPAGMCQAGMGQAGMDQGGMGQPGTGQPGMGQSGMGQPGMGQPRMGQSAMRMGAHAPKLYADTYNYLSKNVMNPIVQEVYEDLKNITPENTMTNSPLGTQMGLKPGMTVAEAGGGSGMPPMGQSGMNMAGMSQQGNMNQMGGNKPKTGSMGAQIAQMMMSDSKSKKLSNPIPLDGSYGQQQGSASSGHITNPGSMEMTRANPATMGMSQGNPGSMSMGQRNPGSMGMGQGNHESYMGKKMGQENTGSQMQDPNANPAMQQMSMGNRNYGEHNEGMKKFNEMFPGVTGVGGDLGFDPMAIAFQMNPANQKQSAMNNMNQMLMGDRKKWIDAANKHLQPSFAQLNQNQPMSQQQQLPGQVQNNAPGQQQMQQQRTPVPQQEVYSATGVPTMIQQPIAPNTTSNSQQGDGTNAQILYQHPTQGQPGQAMYKEHLLPVDTSRNMAPQPSRPQRQYQYNTLGQQIEMLPGDMFKTVPETGPQTLSPLPYPVKPRPVPANVRNTESKTSILGEKTTGRHPRTQLQQIYHQYKGPQTYQHQPQPSTQHNLPTLHGVSAPTIQQNLAPTRQGVSLSEGQLYQTHQRIPIQPLPGSYPDRSRSPVRRAHFEQVGGDTLANNNSAAEPVQVLESIGDNEVLVDKPGDDNAPLMQPMIPVRKSRNGLQDKVYTSSPVTTSWTFHGQNGGYRPVARRPLLYRSNRPVQW